MSQFAEPPMKGMSSRRSQSLIDRITGRLRRVIARAFGLVYTTVETVHLKEGQTLKLLCPNDLTRWRAATFFEKEPETLDWIDGFDKQDVLWDIGANVGLYTLYAGAKGCRVLAFEPSAANYYILNANIGSSTVPGTIDAYCLALADDSRLGRLNMQSLEFGGALSTFEPALGANCEETRSVLAQSTMGYSVDDFVATFSPPFPNHIKIDVDGIEGQIVSGAQRTLADDRLKSLTIELDEARSDETSSVVAKIEAAGLAFKAKRHAPMFEDSPFKSIYNYQFARN